MSDHVLTEDEVRVLAFFAFIAGSDDPDTVNKMLGVDDVRMVEITGKLAQLGFINRSTDATLQ